MGLPTDPGETRDLGIVRGADGGLEVTAHEPVRSSSNNAHTLLSETKAIRAIESGRGHYMGMMSQPMVSR